MSESSMNYQSSASLYEITYGGSSNRLEGWTITENHFTNQDPFSTCRNKCESMLSWISNHQPSRLFDYQERLLVHG